MPTHPHSLGHPGKMTPSAYNDGHFISGLPSISRCEPCILSKSVHSVPKSLIHKRSTRAFEFIHFGPQWYCTSSIPRGIIILHHITFIDDFTRYTWVRFLKVKSDAGIVLRDFVALVERQFDAQILCFLTDNGGEYVNNQLLGFFSLKGILHRL